MSSLAVASVAGADESVSGAASGVVNVFHQIGAAMGLAAISMAVAGLPAAASIDAAQGIMLLLILLCGACYMGTLVAKQGSGNAVASQFRA